MIAEIIGPDGRIHYRRPPDDPMVEEARKLYGYSVRLVETDTAERFNDVTPARLTDLGRRLGSISTPMMKGDNLAVLLCSYFDNPDQEEDGDTGWTPDAVAGCDEVLAAIRALYEKSNR